MVAPQNNDDPIHEFLFKIIKFYSASNNNHQTQIWSRMLTVYQNFRDQGAVFPREVTDPDIALANPRIAISELPQFFLSGFTNNDLVLLTIFYPNQDIIFTREQIMKLIWPNYTENDFWHSENTLNNKISRLRKKLKYDPNKYGWITSHWGVGYSYTLDPDKIEQSLQEFNERS